MNRRNALQIGFLALAWNSANAPQAIAGDPYPSKAVKIISQAPAGNGPDVIARIAAERLSRLWGQQIVMINRPGAGGQLAAQAAVTADPDGYTLYQAITSSMLIMPVTQSLPFDMQRDFVPIGMMGEQPFLVAAAPTLGIDTLEGLISLARKQPGKVLAASAARGSMPHLAAELFRASAEIDITLVPHPSTSQGVQDVMGGRISVIFESLAGLRGFVDAGSVTPLAVTSLTRLSDLPNVPTVAELIPNYAASGWFALMAPLHTPDPIVQKINHDLVAVLAEPELKQKFEKLGTYVRPMSSTETAEFILAEQVRWQPLARKFMTTR
jgi:tripartite-type tricarboxylate transporter receptor subunit TctC